MLASSQRHLLGARPRPVSSGSFRAISTIRSIVIGATRLFMASIPASASPLPSLYSISGQSNAVSAQNGGELDAESPSNGWVLYFASAALVLLGGAFAGLTIALMGQDSIYLQVLSRDETDPQQKNARRVYDLLQRGKHWVLVTLLLSNVVVNETLPVVLDRCLGGGVAAVVGSTLLIVVFGEVLPQSICVRYGLQIGGVMSKPVLALMWLLAPISWPTAKVLDHALGEDHGTVYKKSGLKTLVTLHRSLGEVSERLTQDEVTIISAVLDLKDKPVSSVMTPMNDVFTMSENTILDENMMDLISSAGYSRIPIHEPEKPTNFVGMLLVKILITYDPDDKKPVGEFPLATLPETRPETSCLDIVNFFQEGKSHMVLVSQNPGEDYGALGVVTLEDVIEELIGEEIIDESDVYIDVHKAIRRLQPAPRARPVLHGSLPAEFGVSRQANALSEPGGAGSNSQSNQQEVQLLHPQPDPVAAGMDRSDVQGLSSSPKTTTVMMRRLSAGADGRMTRSTVPVRANIDEMWQHLRHLGPSNPATNPKNTRSTTIKIKPGISAPRPNQLQNDRSDLIVREGHHGTEANIEESNETSRLLGPLMAATDDSHLLEHNYGARSAASDSSTVVGTRNREDTVPGSHDKSVSRSSSGKNKGRDIVTKGLRQAEGGKGVEILSTDFVTEDSRPSGSESGGSGTNVLLSTSDNSIVGTFRRPVVRSGSITENVVETRGIRKVVLETTSSTEDDDEAAGGNNNLRYQNRPHSGLRTPVLPGYGVSDVEEEQAEVDDVLAIEATSQDAAAYGNEQDILAAAHHHGENSGAAKKKNRRKKRKPSKS